MPGDVSSGDSYAARLGVARFGFCCAESSQGTPSGNLGPQGAAGGLRASVRLRDIPRHHVAS